MDELIEASEPFVFRTERRLVVLTGRKASNLPELLDHLTSVSGSSVFYHTHYLYLIQHFVKPRFYNEFANWVSHALHEERLAERLAAIDLLTITSIRNLREALITEIRKHIDASRIHRTAPPGFDFHFCEAKSFIMPTGHIASNVAEFFEHVPKISNSCLHFHFFEARLRLELPTNDFSHWLARHGHGKLAKAIDSLNPYVMTLDELKNQIAKVGRRYVRGRHDRVAT